MIFVLRREALISFGSPTGGKCPPDPRRTESCLATEISGGNLL